MQYQARTATVPFLQTIFQILSTLEGTLLLIHLFKGRTLRIHHIHRPENLGADKKQIIQIQL